MSRKQLSKIARVVLISSLGLASATCAPMRTFSSAFALPFPLPKSIGGVEHAACTPRPVDEPSVAVVRARVDLRRRLRPLDGGDTPLDPRVGILARELRRPARLESGAIVTAVYRVIEEQPTTCGNATAMTGEAPEAVQVRELIAVQVGSGSHARMAFRAQAEAEGPAGFYARDGKPLERAFLRYPVEYMLVTSGFSYARRHPILKKRKPHLGVDLAAPRGTPVVAVGDGEVVEAGWAGPHGRHVGIRHADGSTSGYSHLERIAPGLRVGRLVHKGDVIGAIGTSGLATGPHLHFSVTRRGKLVDPLGTPAPSLPTLTGTALAGLKTSVAEVEAALARHEDRKSVV